MLKKVENRKKIIFIWLIILSPFIFIFSLVSLASFEFFGPLPTFDQLENPQNNLATEILSADSVVIGKFFLKIEPLQLERTFHNNL